MFEMNSFFIFDKVVCLNIRTSDNMNMLISSVISINEGRNMSIDLRMNVPPVRNVTFK